MRVLDLTDELAPALTGRLGCEARVVDNPAGDYPLLVATRHEGGELPTVLVYGHGDVVLGEPERWRPGLDPFEDVKIPERLAIRRDFGRGHAGKNAPCASGCSPGSKTRAIGPRPS